MSKFESQVRRFRQKVARQTTEVYRRSCSGVSYTIAGLSPCSTGKLIGQWSPSEGASSLYNFEGGKSAWEKVGNTFQKDKGIASANRSRAMNDLSPRIDSVTGALSKRNPYYFTNHTEYIQNAEYEGWKNTRKYAMREQGKQQFVGIVNKVIARVRNG